MKRIFEEYKNAEVDVNGCLFNVCGYNDTHLILCTSTNNPNTFRRLSKEAFILEEYKDSKYKYMYFDESQIIKKLKI
jgi:hypothetical protein